MEKPIDFKNPNLQEKGFMQKASELNNSNYWNGSIILVIVLLTSTLAWQCSKKIDSGASQSLKESLNVSSQNLNDAVTAISKSYGYKVLNLNDGSTLKSTLADAAFQDSITLEKIKGVYEYQPVTYRYWCFNCYSKLFKRTGDNSDLIVKLPEAKVFFPARFKVVSPSDSTLKNNLVVDASDYHYYFSNGMLWDYKLAANLTLSDTAIGSIGIQSSRSSGSAYNYASSYGFPNGYNIIVNVKSGDTATSSIALSSTTATLFKETVQRIKSSTTMLRERVYLLDVGNVEFKRSSGSDSTKVYVGGVLQTKAIVEVVDGSGSNGSICGGRDVKVTFDDGTSALLSTLLGPSLAILNNVVVNMQNVYFAQNIVNYIAFNIFKNNTP